MKTKILLSTVFLILLISTSFAQQKISAKEAANYIDSTVTVVDTVSGVYLSRTGTYFINMGGEYPDNAFTAVIFKNDTSPKGMDSQKFHDVKSLEGKVVEVTGKVKEYRWKPEIVVGKWEQIK